MRRTMKRASDKPRRALARWATALGLGLMSLQASAFSTGQLQATDIPAAAQELADKLGYATPGHCQLAALEWENGQLPERFFKLECPGKVLLLKYAESSSADMSAAPVVAFLKEQMPAEQFARLQLPVAEFSFDRPGEGQGYYRVYPWTEATCLSNWIRNLVTSSYEGLEEINLRRLLKVYAQIGALVGSTHRVALIREDQKETVLPRLSKRGSFNGFNLLVTPEDEVIVHLDAIVPVTENELLDKSLPAPLEDFDRELAFFERYIDAWSLGEVALSVSVGFIYSYCETLAGLKLGNRGQSTAVCDIFEEVAHRIARLDRKSVV